MGEGAFPAARRSDGEVCVTRSELTRFVAREGWTIEHRRAGHLALRHPTSDVFILVSATPSDHRAWLNIRADMRRALRRVKPGL